MPYDVCLNLLKSLFNSPKNWHYRNRDGFTMGRLRTTIIETITNSTHTDLILEDLGAKKRQQSR
ncbi:MAG TPA: hypothetical protein VJZ32_03260 [Candidatus Bathyarchaeia archaeon]|nr:hypothetical protein [Candidatus Bathyarchaeia archaeon]